MDVKKEDGFAALHLAALNGHREVAAILLSQNGGRAKVDLRNNRRQTPLHLATSQGHWSLVELLVHHNADVGSTDEDGDTVLHIAIAKSPNQQTAVPTPESSRDSPLIYAVRCLSSSILRESVNQSIYIYIYKCARVQSYILKLNNFLEK